LTVIRREHPAHVTLKARPVAKLYRTSDLGYPCFYFLDQDGRVRRIETGYSTDLVTRLGKVIDRLTSAPPTAR
jgi:hypothetical protein